jgi:hypothetical protein
LFGAIVQDVWREQQAQARKMRAEIERGLESTTERLEQLEEAFIFERRIDQNTYDRQRDRLSEELALLQFVCTTPG